LITSSETTDLKDKTQALSRQIMATIDLERLIDIARRGCDGNGPASVYHHIPRVEALRNKLEAAGGDSLEARRRVRLAVAWDKAFCFYYRDNLDLLEALGAELVFFSPIKDSELPPDLDGMYIGGGYPEVWAEELQRNISMKSDIKMHIEAGMPVYAECGGLMYMCERLTDIDGRTFEMTGVLPAESHMTGSLKRFGYVEVTLDKDTLLAPAGSKIRAHEFHFSETGIMEGRGTEAAHDIIQCYEVSNASRSWRCGFRHNKTLAGYAHLHFWSNPAFAEGFIESCKSYGRKKEDGKTNVGKTNNG
jgi:cobyrinic acid a,c-diamide synthase